MRAVRVKGFGQSIHLSYVVTRVAAPEGMGTAHVVGFQPTVIASRAPHLLLEQVRRPSMPMPNATHTREREREREKCYSYYSQQCAHAFASVAKPVYLCARAAQNSDGRLARARAA